MQMGFVQVIPLICATKAFSLLLAVQENDETAGPSQKRRDTMGQPDMADKLCLAALFSRRACSEGDLDQ